MHQYGKPPVPLKFIHNYPGAEKMLEYHLFVPNDMTIVQFLAISCNYYIIFVTRQLVGLMPQEEELMERNTHLA